MNFWRPLAGLLLIGSIQATAADLSPLAACLSAALRGYLEPFYRFEPVQGELQSFDRSNWPEFLKNEVGHAQLYRLGSGVMGTVYRVVPERGSPWILKMSKQASEEYLTLELIRIFCERAGGCGMKIPRARYIDTPHGNSQLLAFPDVQGRNLHSLLVDPATPAAVKRKLEKSYKSMLDQVETHLAFWHPIRRSPQKEFFESHYRGQKEVTMDGLPTLALVADKKTAVPALEAWGMTPIPNSARSESDLIPLLKTDNFIVTPGTLELTLVDPF